MQKKRSDYFSYLLRLWRNGDQERSWSKDKESGWRASLESPQNGRRIGFLSLEDLFDFLREQTGEDRDKGQGNLEEGGL
jgi:hypothetical protein